MKKSTIIISVLLLSTATTVNGQCNISLGVTEMPQTETIPESTMKLLTSRLTQIISADDGIAVGPGINPFVVTGRFDHIMEETIPGPPAQTVLRTNLSLYVADINTQTIYASTSIELKGVGTSRQRALTSALQGLNTQNNNIRTMTQNARHKIMEYYNHTYPQLIAKARRAAASTEYTKALWILAMIPECCSGYDECCNATADIYQKYIDSEGERLLTKANAAWNPEQTSEAANEAFGLLSQIDPESKSFNRAQILSEEIKCAIKDDLNFRLRQKYSDSLAIKRQQIESARAVGIAFGSGQQPITTNLNWIK